MGQAPNTPAARAGPIRADPAVRRIARDWRRLSNGGPTLVGCSAGADSSALAIALAAAGAKPVLAHIVHDFRPAGEALADRDAAAALAGRLGLRFAEERIRARDLGRNLEAASRRLRYRALARIALDHGCAHVATAHHANDQFETVLMRLVRGASPAGLGGIRPRLPALGVTIIRPMLGVTRADAERICALAGWRWRTDATNADSTRLRTAVRLGPAAALAALAPRVERRASRAADLLRDAAGLVRDHAEALVAAGRVDDPASGTPRYAWHRERLRDQRAIVVGAVLRRASSILQGPAGLDRRGGGSIDQAVRAVRSRGTDPKRFTWGSVEILVRAGEVRVQSAGGPRAPSGDEHDHRDR
jgi:tRNA(Ile)-lysidine synthase